VDVETCVAPGEDFLDKGKADELFPEKQREDLMGEDFLDNLVMETTDTVEGTIRGCASFCNQTVNVGMEIDALSEGLDDRHYSRHELKTCGCVQGFHKCTHRRETEIIEELSLVTEEQPEHLRDGEDNLAVRDIQQKLLPHPLAPFLTAFCMARRAETTSLTGKHEKTLFSTTRTPDAGKPAHRIAAVEILLDNILDDGPEISVLLFKTILVFSKKPLEIMKKHPVEDGALRMSRIIDSFHGRSHRSRNRPTSWIRPSPPEKATRAPAQKDESGRENVNRC